MLTTISSVAKLSIKQGASIKSRLITLAKTVLPAVDGNLPTAEAPTYKQLPFNVNSHILLNYQTVVVHL